MNVSGEYKGFVSMRHVALNIPITSIIYRKKSLISSINCEKNHEFHQSVLKSNHEFRQSVVKKNYKFCQSVVEIIAKLVSHLKNFPFSSICCGMKS